jgi:hypothetical protein
MKAFSKTKVIFIKSLVVMGMISGCNSSADMPLKKLSTEEQCEELRLGVWKSWITQNDNKTYPFRLHISVEVSSRLHGTNLQWEKGIIDRMMPPSYRLSVTPFYEFREEPASSENLVLNYEQTTDLPKYRNILVSCQNETIARVELKNS